MKRYFTLLLLFCLHTVFAQQNVLTPEDVAKMEFVANAVISPKGDKVAYQKIIPVSPTKENQPANVYLYVYDMGSKSSRAFVTGYSASNIAFRPGHNSITFTTSKENDKFKALYEINVDGGEAHKIYEFDASISSYNWHPDGNKLAFVSNEPEKSTEETQLPYQPEIYETGLHNSQAFIVTPDNQDAQKINIEGHITALQWSPDGNKLAVSAAPSSLVDDYYTGQRIYIVDANTMTTTATIDHQAKLGTFKWSPDGKRMAFIAGEDKHDPIDGRIFISEATGGSPKIMQNNFEGKFEDLTWMDDNTIVYLASEGVYSSLGTLNLNGKMNKFYGEKDINITGFSSSKDKSIAFVGNTARHPGELFLLNSRNSTAERLTNSNPWLKEETFGKQQVISYKAKDGLEIQGILIHPVDKSANIPLITVVHGGPEAHYKNGWLTSYSMPGQIGAGEGYAVFYPNYRGSTGRGAKFAKSSQGDPGGKEFDDIIDGIDYLIENYNVDKDKVGVTGGSYGGYATAWMSTRHSERFAAGVMSVGISDNISKWGTSDIPEEMFLVHSRKRIWDDYQFFLERSPIYYADQSQTPLLIMHGKDDTRVNPGQSFELYRHIKTRTDNPVRLVLYPGEGHGNRNSTARYDFNLRMMRWFDTFLKDDNKEMPETTLELEGK